MIRVQICSCALSLHMDAIGCNRTIVMIYPRGGCLFVAVRRSSRETRKGLGGLDCARVGPPGFRMAGSAEKKGRFLTSTDSWRKQN